MDFAAWMRGLAKAKRDRQLVKEAAISDEAKAKLLAEVDAFVAKLDAEFSRGQAPVKKG